MKSLLLQKMRASLASLGIFIGTTTVIWLVAMGEGVSYEAQQQIKELGATNIIVRSKNASTGDQKTDAQRVQTYGLLRADYERILTNISTIDESVAMRELRFELRRGDRAVDCKLIGCAREYLRLNRLTVARGRWMEARDKGEKVVVLAHDTAARLFPYENPIGQTVWVGSEFYIVIGQTSSRAASAAIGGSLDSHEYNQDAYIPLETMRVNVGDLVMRRTGSGFNFQGEKVELSQITLTVRELQDVDETAAAIEFLLKKFHDEEDYAVVVPKELLRQAERTRAMFNVLLVVIAGISLFVGGIGIMNIMLATVTERTREIGVRRALGAKRNHIIEQFLTETILLTGIGGLLGVLFGLMCADVFDALRSFITLIQPDALPDIVHSLKPRIAPWSVGLSLCISLGVGILFGVYPARKAALLDPIEALRHE